jgi:hypothetical protein
MPKAEATTGLAPKKNDPLWSQTVTSDAREYAPATTCSKRWTTLQPEAMHPGRATLAESLSAPTADMPPGLILSSWIPDRAWRQACDYQVTSSGLDGRAGECTVRPIAAAEERWRWRSTGKLSPRYEHGWAQVGPRLDWALTRFLEGHITFHPVAIEACGSLGYTIWIERGEARLEGSNGVRPFALRVTQLYRRENGVWKIIQRHADPMIEKIEAPKSVS